LFELQLKGLHCTTVADVQLSPSNIIHQRKVLQTQRYQYTFWPKH